MDSFPAPLRRYLLDLTIVGRHAAYILTSAAGEIRSGGGSLELYGITDLAPGEPVGSAALCLEGLLPLHGDEPLYLPSVQTDSGHFADIHVGLADDGAFVLVLDANSDVERQSALQQRGNELSLMRERLAPDLDGPLELREDHVSENLTCAIFRLRWADGPSITADEFVRIQEAGARAIVRAAVDAGAVVERGGPRQVSTFFGILPSTAEPATKALEAAGRAMESLRDLHGPGAARLGLTVGIATGTARVQPSRQGGRFYFSGLFVEHALDLSSLARRGQILVDAETRQRAQADSKAFGEFEGEAGGRRMRAYVLGGERHASELELLCNALAFAVMHREGGGVFRFVGRPPSWVAPILGEDFEPERDAPFLENFIAEAEEHWSQGRPGVLRSGPWSQPDPHGTEHHLEAAAFSLPESGGPRLVVRRMADDYQRWQELLQRARETSLDLDSLTREVQKKEVLLHCIVHDLKAPLAGLVGNLSIMKAKAMDPERVRDLAERGLVQARRQSEMIRLTLDVFAAEIHELESFETDPSRAPDALECARAAVDGLRDAYAQREVALVLEADPGASPSGELRVVGRADRLQRIFGNLLENAMRHSPRGAEVTVRVGPGSTTETVRCAVEDRGPGVPESVVPSLFQRFVRGGDYEGVAGLGLYYCRFTTEQWGGTIGYKPREGGGSIFEFELPRPRADAADDGGSRSTESV